MDNFKVIRDFSSNRYTDTELSVMASHVVAEMTDNVNFPTPNPALQAITTANAAYIEALNKAVSGNREDIVIKNSCRKLIETLLKQETEYAQSASGGNEAIILSSGFEVAKKPAPVGPLARATGIKVNAGTNKGSIMVDCDVVEHAAFYEYEYTDAPSTPNSIWLKKTSTKHKVLIEGLTSGKQYVFRVAGAGSDPSRNWSDEITSFVL